MNIYIIVSVIVWFVGVCFFYTIGKNFIIRSFDLYYWEETEIKLICLLWFIFIPLNVLGKLFIYTVVKPFELLFSWLDKYNN